MDKQYTLPDLPYDYTALEPHYSARLLDCTMTSTTPPTLRARTRPLRSSPKLGRRAISRPSTSCRRTWPFIFPDTYCTRSSGAT